MFLSRSLPRFFFVYVSFHDLKLNFNLISAIFLFLFRFSPINFHLDTKKKILEHLQKLSSRNGTGRNATLQVSSKNISIMFEILIFDPDF